MVLVVWVSAGDGSALFLFMTRVFANNADHVLSAHDFARFTQSFY
jgi:hypothetical protein